MPPLPPIPPSPAAQLAMAQSTIQTLQLTHNIIIRPTERPASSPDEPIWYLPALLTVQAAVADITEVLGNVNIFRVMFRRVSVVFKDLKPGIGGQVTWWGRVELPASISTWTVAHELGHFWDSLHFWLLSRDMERFTHGRTIHRGPFWNPKPEYHPGDLPVPCCTDENFNRHEDFAESVAAYIYPEQAAATALQRSQAYNKPECNYAAWGIDHFHDTRRGQFIRSLIQKYS